MKLILGRHRIFWAAVLGLALTAAVALGAQSEVRTFGSAGDGAGLVGPHASGVAVAEDGTVYVADHQQSEVEVFSHGGRSLRTWSTTGAPTAIALDGERVLVAVADGVHAYSGGGDHLADLGGPGSSPGLAAGGGVVYASDPESGRVEVLGGDPIGESELVEPAGLAVGADGDLYVADPGDGTVKRFRPDGSLAGSWFVSGPGGVGAAPDGSIYVTQSGHRVGRFLADGARVADLTEGLNVPRGVAVDCRGTALVIDNSNPRVHVFAEPGAGAPPCVPPPPPPPVAEVKAEAAEAQPEAGRTTRATVLDGSVVVGRGTDRRRLTGRAMLPMGTRIDAQEGTLRLEFEALGDDRAKYGRNMDAEFSEGTFAPHQAQDDSLVEIVLEGSQASSARAGGDQAQTARRRNHRRVWSRARGRFRTRGNHGAATVRGTRWLTEERKRGTFFKVTEGSIAVREFRTGRTRVLQAPAKFLARGPCVSRRRFPIRLRPPAGTVVTGVRVTVAGRRVPVRGARKLRAIVDLRGMPKGVVKVRIEIRTAAGTTLRGVRKYHTCHKDRLPSKPPTL